MLRVWHNFKIANYIFLIFLFMINIIIDNSIFHITISILAASAVFLSIPYLKGFSRYGTLFFIILGVGLNFVNRLSIEDMVSSFSNMVNIVVFLGILPILSIPIRFEKINLRLKHNGGISQRQIFTLSQSIVFSLASFINMAAVPITSSLLTDKLSVSGKKARKILAESLSRGHAFAMVWTPIGAGVALVTELTGLSIIYLLPFCFFIACFGIVLDNFLFLVRNRHNKIPEMSLRKAIKFSINDIMKIVIPMMLFMSIIIILDIIFKWGVLVLITLSVIPYTILYSLFKRKGKMYIEYLKHHFSKDMPNMNVQFGLLISVGMLIKTMENTGYLEDLFSFVSKFSNILGSNGILILTLLVVVASTMLGMHSIVAVTIVASIIDPSHAGINEMIFGVTLLVSYSVSVMLSPFNGTINLVSLTTNSTILSIFKRNLPFATIFSAIILLILIALNNLI